MKKLTIDYADKVIAANDIFIFFNAVNCQVQSAVILMSTFEEKYSNNIA